MFSERKLKFLHPKEKVQMVSGIQSVHDYIIAWPFLVTDSLYVISLTRRINFWNLNTFKLPKVQPFTATDRFINRLRRTELKMSLKFSIACGLFQLLLVILFSVLTNYGDHASPPHKRKGATDTSANVSETLPVNDVSIYYPSKS